MDKERIRGTETQNITYFANIRDTVSKYPVSQTLGKKREEGKRIKDNG